MIQRIKDALNNSYLWLLFLLGCIAYFWRKEDDLENKLEEEKANETLKGQKQDVVHADERASDAVSDFKRLSEQYKREHPND